MSLFVKLCGIRTEADLEAAVTAGADAVGFVLTPSPRQVSLSEATRLRTLLPSTVLGVAVYHRPAPGQVERVQEAMAPDLHQSAPESLDGAPRGSILPVVVDGDDVARVIAVAAGGNEMGLVLVDSRAKGGTGIRTDWERLAGVANGSKLVLAGGLHPGNVARAISVVRPFGVDVSSGIESAPGEKDHDLMRAFVAAAREAGQREERDTDD